jgi:FMN-dependent dehydrogenase
MRVITCVEDLRRLARRRVPRMFDDYVDSGSWTESTYRANERDLAAICFRQRVPVNIEKRSVRSTMIGEEVAMPVALAPTGLCGMQHADGEILAARAAEAFGVPFCLSTLSICSIEDVAANATKPFWFQFAVFPGERNRNIPLPILCDVAEPAIRSKTIPIKVPYKIEKRRIFNCKIFSVSIVVKIFSALRLRLKQYG